MIYISRNEKWCGVSLYRYSGKPLYFNTHTDGKVKTSDWFALLNKKIGSIPPTGEIYACQILFIKS